MKYVCTVCGYVYDEDEGIPEYSIKPGTKFASFPDSWTCPMCGSPKSAFVPVKGEKEEAKEQVEVETKEEEKLHQVSYAELSVMCSSLALSCDKEQLAKQKEDFAKLADYFESKASYKGQADLKALAELLNKDVSVHLPEGKKAAEDDKDRGAKRVLTWAEKVTNLLVALVGQYQDKGIDILMNTKIWVCDICGFVYIGEVPPAICPICKVPSFKILPIERKQ